MGLLDGQVVMVTGGARGQGRAHAITSAREGADIVLVDIAAPIKTAPYPMSTAADIADTVQAIEKLDRRALGIEADVRSQEQLDGAVAQALGTFGQIDSLIANAGIWTMSPIWEASEELWDETIAVNLTGVWKSAKAVIPHMIDRQRGSIVITSSTNGLEPGFNFGHYTASKHGVIGLMKTMALELARHGIRCNAISPGAVETPMTQNGVAWDLFAGHESGTEAEAIEGGYHFHALKETAFLSPEAIADTALYLNSRLASSVTGVTIPVEAGHLLLTGVNNAPVRSAQGQRT